MNVFFCDVCGVRVTDVDLHGGHGMRKGHDVICATCLDIGHGKDWLARREARRGAAAAVGTMTPPPAAPVVAVLDAARDRARTVTESGQPAVVEAVAVAPEPDHNSTARIESGRQPQLADAVSGFAAMGSASVEAAKSDDSDSADLEVARPELTPAGGVRLDAAAQSPFQDGEADGDEIPLAVAPKKDGEKDETVMAERGVEAAPPEVLEPARQAKKTSGRMEKSRTPGPKSAKSGRANGKSSRRKAGPSNMQVLVVSGVTLTMVVIFGIVLITSGKTGTGAGSRIETNLTKDLSDLNGRTRKTVESALASKNESQLVEARDMVQRLSKEAEEYGKKAMAREPSWSEEDIGRQLEQMGVNTTLSLGRNVRDELMKIRGGK